ncbi:MAG: PAS domain-containing sensor histidine kinase [Deltaproteobacteria bacterium]|nr:PAS domain-containing sensor histidine kinase [Deltaproteobacteria bacterium]
MSGFFFEHLVNSLPMEIAVFDEKMKIVWVNKRVIERFKIKNPQQLSGKKCFELFFGKKQICDGCPLSNGLEELSPKTFIIEETEFKRYFKISIAPLHEKGREDKKLYVEIIQDITDQKMVEEEIRKLSDFNSAIIKNAPVAIFTIDKTGKFMSVNPALASISGLGEEAEKKLLKFNWLQNQYTINCGLADYIKRGLQGEPFELQDFPFTNYKGDKGQYIHFRGVPIRDKEGNVECLLCIIEETTEKVMAKIQSIQDAKMSVIGRLMTAVAHELNNPLAVISANSELACELFEEIKDRNHSKEMRDIYNCLDAIQREAFRCKKIIKDMLDLTKKDGFEFKEIDLFSCIKEVIASYDFYRLNVDLIFEVEESLPPVVGDLNALKQCFSNLLQNAIDAVETREKGIIKIKMYRGNAHVIVEIEDNGIGIHESILDRIFEPFFSTKNEGRRIGLGLTLCYEFLKRMGARIDVKSILGKGTVFTLTFPVSNKTLEQ